MVRGIDDGERHGARTRSVKQMGDFYAAATLAVTEVPDVLQSASIGRGGPGCVQRDGIENCGRRRVR